jgi:hypothetical protein
MSIFAFLAGAFNLLCEIEAGLPFTHTWSFKEGKKNVQVTATGSLESAAHILADGELTQDASRVTLISAFQLIATALSGKENELYHSYKLADGEYLNVALAVQVL